MNYVLRRADCCNEKPAPYLKIVEPPPPDLEPSAPATVVEAWGDGLGLVVAERIEDGRVAHAKTGLETWIVAAPADMPGLADRVSRHIEVVTIIPSASTRDAADVLELARRLEARGIEARIIARGA